MEANAIRYVDDQGRIVLPNHIRKALNLGAGSAVEVVLEGNETIRVRPTVERCCICGGSVQKKEHMPITKDKHICVDCAQKAAKALVK